MASTPRDMRRTYLAAGVDFLSLVGNTVADLTPKALDGQIKSYIYEQGVSPPVGLLRYLWRSWEEYLAELLKYVCQDSLRQLSGRIAQINSRQVKMPLALHWWLFDRTMGVAMKLSRTGNYQYEDVLAEFMGQANQLLASLGLNRPQCLALWGIRLQRDVTGHLQEPALLAEVVSSSA